ncbi:RNA polymerase III subunit RPC82-domain-containing protein [Suillus subluteus]|nr:RNA polymerase III subunit RPC82-domain-containing protein [Suillus subluteus]
MADAETSRLCVQIVRSHFGPLTANVASALLTRGRLSLAQLIRYTMIKPRTVRAAILVMVQHNILWHSNTEEEGEMLEFHTLECLMRLRFGRFVWQAEQLFGPSVRSSLYSQTLYKLISGAYLKPSTLLSHHSPRDKRIKYEAEEKAKITGFPTAKELREAQETAEARLKREEEEAESVGLKRKPKDLIGHRSSKKKAIEEDMVDDGVYFRVNFDKFNTYIRNKLIEMAAGERFNRSAALVMRVTLKATEVRQKSVSDARSDPTSTAAIAILISDDDDLSTGLVTSTKKASSASLVKDYLGLMSAVDNPTPAGKAASFISLIDNKVYVEFGIVSKRLRRRNDTGTTGVRIVRLLLDIGKMDEKQIAKVAMMPNNVVRPLLAALSSDFLISTQEVPRSADRNPTRTFYLWHVDLHKAYSALLGHLYKTLYNIGMRRQAEQEEPTVKAVLEKRARTDVAQDENLLSRMERDVLKEWETKQEKLTVLEMRVEEAVFILRDLDKVGSHEDI